MDYLYSLYDALISISVPNDKARAVVDAMERDMGTTLATKADLDAQRLATKADLNELRLETRADLNELRLETRAALNELRTATKADIDELRHATKADIDELRHATNVEFKELRGEFRHDIALLRKDMEMVSTTVTFRLGSLMVVCFGLFFAALRLT